MNPAAPLIKFCKDTISQKGNSLKDKYFIYT